MQSSPLWSFGNSERACFVRIESSFAFFFDDREADGHRTAMVDGKRADGVTRAFDALTVVQLEDLDGKGGALEAEALHAFEDSGGPFGTPETEGLGAALKGHGSDQSDHAEQVIGVHVGKEDVLERERDPVSHHLTLGAFAAIEHQRLAFAVERERGDVALDGRTRRGCPEEVHCQRHGR